MVKGKIAVLGEHHFTMGFLFAGVQDTFTVKDSGAAAEQRLIELISSGEFSVIFISEKLSEQMDWRLKKRISNLAYPVIVPLPDITGEGSEAANIKAFIKRALGFDIATK